MSLNFDEEIVLEGFLKKVKSSVKVFLDAKSGASSSSSISSSRSKNMHCTLFLDRMEIRNKQKDKKAKDVIDLSQGEIKVSQINPKPLFFTLQTPKGTTIFRAASTPECERWVSNLETVITCLEKVRDCDPGDKSTIISTIDRKTLDESSVIGKVIHDLDEDGMFSYLLGVFSRMELGHLVERNCNLQKISKFICSYKDTTGIFPMFKNGELYISEVSLLFYTLFGRSVTKFVVMFEDIDFIEESEESGRLQLKIVKKGDNSSFIFSNFENEKCETKIMKVLKNTKLKIVVSRVEANNLKILKKIAPFYYEFLKSSNIVQTNEIYQDEFEKLFYDFIKVNCKNSTDNEFNIKNLKVKMKFLCKFKDSYYGFAYITNLGVFFFGENYRNINRKCKFGLFYKNISKIMVDSGVKEIQFNLNDGNKLSLMLSDLYNSERRKIGEIEIIKMTNIKNFDISKLVSVKKQYIIATFHNTFYAKKLKKMKKMIVRKLNSLVYDKIGIYKKKDFNDLFLYQMGIKKRKNKDLFFIVNGYKVPIKDDYFGGRVKTSIFSPNIFKKYKNLDLVSSIEDGVIEINSSDKTKSKAISEKIRASESINLIEKDTINDDEIGEEIKEDDWIVLKEYSVFYFSKYSFLPIKTYLRLKQNLIDGSRVAICVAFKHKTITQMDFEEIIFSERVEDFPNIFHIHFKCNYNWTFQTYQAIEIIMFIGSLQYQRKIQETASKMNNQAQIEAMNKNSPKKKKIKFSFRKKEGNSKNSKKLSFKIIKKNKTER